MFILTSIYMFQTVLDTYFNNSNKKWHLTNTVKDNEQKKNIYNKYTLN